MQVNKVNMDDSSHLRGKQGDGEKQGLINSDNAPSSESEAHQLLQEMKRISKLIEEVSLPASLIKYYIGCDYFP